MAKRSISVSTVAYEGFPIETAFGELVNLGIRLVEPAYIKGYMTFSEDDFEDAAIGKMRQLLQHHGLSSIAISAHMNCGAPDAQEMLARRLRFTAGIGAHYTITNASANDQRETLIRTIEANIPLAEKLGVIIALENPGNGPTNLMVDGKAAAALIRHFNSPHVRMNYDTSNALTCTEGKTRPEQDIDYALPHSCHVHLKDVVRKNDRWEYVAIGAGEIDYALLLSKLANWPDLPLTLELPLRLQRTFHQDPVRRPDVLPLNRIATAIQQSWDYCTQENLLATGTLPGVRH
jgi:sugar phosphate isomerase/epimerase